MESLCKSIVEDISSQEYTAKKRLKVSITKKADDDTLEKRVCFTLPHSSIGAKLIQMLCGLEYLRVDARDSSTSSTADMIVEYIRKICCVKTLRLQMKKDGKEEREVCRSLYDDVLESTECHAFSFDKTEPSCDKAKIAKSILEYVLRISQQRYLGLKLCPALSSHTILGIVDDVKGKITGYLTRKSPWDRLLSSNFDLDMEDASIVYYNLDPKKHLTSGSFTVDPNHSSIGQGREAGKLVYHQLQGGRGDNKIDIRGLGSKKKSSEREVVVIDGFDGKRFRVENLKVDLCLPMKSQVQSAVNHEKMEWNCGPTKFRKDKNGKYQGYIPLTLKRNRLSFFSRYGFKPLLIFASIPPEEHDQPSPDALDDEDQHPELAPDDKDQHPEGALDEDDPPPNPPKSPRRRHLGKRSKYDYLMLINQVSESCQGIF
jgi:hypothetical protein